MRITSLYFVILLIISGSYCHSNKNDNEIIDLSDTWNFQLDSANVGISGKWFDKELNEVVKPDGTRAAKQGEEDTPPYDQSIIRRGPLLIGSWDIEVLSRGRLNLKHGLQSMKISHWVLIMLISRSWIN